MLRRSSFVQALMSRPWLMALLGLPLVLLFIGAIVALILWQQLPALDVLTDYQPHQPLRVLSEFEKHRPYHEERVRVALASKARW